MANKLKKPAIPKAEEKPPKKESKKENPGVDRFKTDREEKIDFKKLARDERTWKIIGTTSLLISIFLFIAFVSYFFTWKEDQDKVFNNPSFLFDNDIKVSNLLGRLGASVSHFFIRQGFGIASLLFCTFFFVVGINLLLNRKVFSIWRNLRYVTVGLLICSTSLAFLFANSSFPVGGEVGRMINTWLVNFLGVFGTAALLLVLAASYLIWQFNPSFNLPETHGRNNDDGEDVLTQPAVEEANSIIAERKANALKTGAAPLAVLPGDEDDEPELEIIEKPDDEHELTSSEPLVEREISDDLMHNNELSIIPEEDEEELAPKSASLKPANDLELEIKTVVAGAQEQGEIEKGYSDLPHYEPTLDLRDYTYPGLDLL
ncbi:MAG TPA: DNA translocase FtsK 4TM domain-containing protein, partial [Chitinophagaceae bacterium]|nr:DNA translocase FtsK 4TM domain-containing protein [Chitinophagaceae bacterium]